MSNLLSQDQAALKMLFTEDIYLVREKKEVTAPVIQPETAKAEVRADLEVKQPVENKTRPAVEVPERDPSLEAAPADFEYLGDNNKYFLVVIDEKIYTRINPVHQEMLLKVMNAKKLELRDLAILNINRYPGTQIAALKAFFSCSRVALFGVPPAQIGLPPIALNKTESAGNLKILATYSLEDMRDSPDKKKEFWNVMKNF